MKDLNLEVVTLSIESELLLNKPVQYDYDKFYTMDDVLEYICTNEVLCDLLHEIELAMLHTKCNAVSTQAFNDLKGRAIKLFSEGVAPDVWEFHEKQRVDAVSFYWGG